jgi:membrane associated rhomboid family serine protease
VADIRPVRREPIFNAPTIVLVVIALFVAIHAVRDFLLSYEDQMDAIIYLAFIPARLTELGARLPGGFSVGLSSTLTHAFLHGDWLHLTINGAWLLAFGALFFFVMNPSGVIPLVGASGAISGMMGGAFRLIFSTEGGGFSMLHHHPMAVPRMPLALALRDQRTMTAVLIWLAINLVFGFGLGDMFQSGEIAWEAHIGGFLLGFLFFSWFDRGPGYGTWGDPTSR